jgi:hypothetical protein
MLAIPPDLLSRYDASLAQNEIPEYQRPHYRRWLRFYLDFCAKYERPAHERESVRAFRRKLEQKGQAEWMRTQAIDVVRLYFFLGGPEDRHRSETRNDPRAPDARPVPRRAPTPQAQRASVPGSSNPEGRSQGRAPLPRTGARHDIVTTASSAPGTSPPGQTSNSVLTPKRIAPAPPPLPVADPRPPPTAGAAPNGWPELYSRLDAAIKVRHYSAKTLKTYRSWARKLQGFTRNKPTAELTVDDVKSFLTHPCRGWSAWRTLPGLRRP